MMKKRFIIVMGILTVVLIAVIALSLSWGTYQISLAEIMQTLIGNGSKVQATTIFQLRLPRIAVAVLVGVALSTAGCILQSVTKNELAEPGIIGINAGAALAVVLVIATSTTSYYSQLGDWAIYFMPFAGIFGALVAAVLIYTLSYQKGISPTRLILIGIGVNAGLNALITLFQLTLSKGDYNQALTWISGSLWGSSWQFFWLILPIVGLVCAWTLLESRSLDILDLGDELATGLGIRVESTRRKFLFFAVALAAASTAVAGNIAFLGLLGPQLGRKLVGPIHRRLIPTAGLLSAIIIIFADAISRNLFSPIEIPVGITISIVGVPYFIYLMLKMKE
ncbi:MAG: FecCD family ABC transporter permease [Culicoidibacterales bacterium]